jgi:hypothetical protein
MPQVKIQRNPPPSAADEKLVGAACEELLRLMREQSQADWMRPYVERLQLAWGRVRGAVQRDRVAGPAIDLAKLHDVVENLIVAEVTDSWKGGGDPADIPRIVAERDKARVMTIVTGELHVLDHIVPVTHPVVCGLTVPWNLRVIHWRVNGAKGNTWNPDQLELFS